MIGRIFLSVVLQFLATGAVTAQYSWQIIHKDSNFQDVSCYGRFCTATGYVYGSESGYRVWNSDDWGKTWKEIAPSLPDSLLNKPFNAVHRLDSLHVFIAGSKGIFITSADGGNTWEGKKIADVNFHFLHFSALQSGICLGRVGDGKVNQLFTTTNGGETWKHVPIDPFFQLTKCRSYGEGKFKVFNKLYGSIYSTEDNWITTDSVTQIIDDTDAYGFTNLAFSSGDTMIAHGTHVFGSFSVGKLRGLIVSTTNSGQSWKLLSLPPMDSGGIGQIISMTRPDNDTIIAGGWSYNKLAISIDGGNTWQFDTLPVPKISLRTDVYKLVMLDNGNVLGIYGDDRLSARQRLFLGEPTRADVIAADTKPSITVYPNPASSVIAINLPEDVQSIQIFDALGRIVKTLPTQITRNLTVDISEMEAGLYHAIVKIASGMYTSSFIVSR